MTEAVVLAGGKGTRLATRLNGLPKPLVNVGGSPLLERQLLYLKTYGIRNVTLLVNYKGSIIEDFLRTNNNFGLSINLIDDGEPRGTAGAMLAALPQFSDDDILVLYGDTLFNVDLDRMQRFHNYHDGSATLFLHPNDHPQDSDLVGLDSNNRITGIYPYPRPESTDVANLVNAALYIVRRKELIAWEHLTNTSPQVIDFAKDLFPQMINAGQKLYGYNSPEYIKDVGTPERLDKAELDIFSGRYAKGSLSTPRSAVFLDRDGVINQEVGFLHCKEDFILLPGVGEAIRRLNHSGLLSVIVTNQPVIARGECTAEELATIHARMDNLLGAEGAYIDRLYYCPHHPDRGFTNERPDLKIRCMCRKPEPGMLIQARRDLHIDFSTSWLIGDRTSDVLAAKRVGVQSVLVRTGAAGEDNKYPVSPDHIVNNLSEAITLILSKQPQ